MLQASLDAMLNATLDLECVLLAEVPGHEQEWAVRVRDAVLDLEQALRVHRAGTEGHNGMFASMNDLPSETLPTRDRRVRKFCVEHEDFMEQAKALRADVQKAIQVFQPPEHGVTVEKPFAQPVATGCVPDFGSIRQRGTQLVETLRKHKEDETKLLQETAMTDVGVGD